MRLSFFIEVLPLCSVSTTPGATALTRMFLWPHSTAMVAVRFSRPALAPPYWPVIGQGCEPLREEMLMMEPPRVMTRAAAWQAKKAHFMLRLTTLSYCCSVMLISGPTSATLALPALFTQQSM